MSLKGHGYRHERELKFKSATLYVLIESGLEDIMSCDENLILITKIIITENELSLRMPKYLFNDMATDAREFFQKQVFGSLVRNAEYQHHLGLDVVKILMEL